MRITGKLLTVGTITTCENHPQEFHDDLNFETVKGLLIESQDDGDLRALSNLLHANVDIYPHPVDGLSAGQCTPENYAHALASLAHAEDHLAREIRSSQALLAANAALGKLLHKTRLDLRLAERLNDNREDFSDRDVALATAQVRIAELEATLGPPSPTNCG